MKYEVTNCDNRNSCNYLIFLHASITASLHPISISISISNRYFYTYACFYLHAYYDFRSIANLNNDGNGTSRFRNGFTAVTNDYPKCNTSGIARRHKECYSGIFCSSLPIAQCFAANGHPSGCFWQVSVK